jgi:hypothetical protein
MHAGRSKRITADYRIVRLSRDARRSCSEGAALVGLYVILATVMWFE